METVDVEEHENAVIPMSGLDLSLYHTQDRLMMLFGSIGTGKTTLLQAIIKSLCEAGIFSWGVCYCQSAFNKKANHPHPLPLRRKNPHQLLKNDPLPRSPSHPTAPTGVHLAARGVGA